MTLITFSPGVNTSFSTQLNSNFTHAYSRAVASTPYTGTGFDATRSNSAGTTTNNTTLTVASGTIYDYVRIVLVVQANAFGSTAADYARLQLKVETSVASAASWTTRFDKQVAGQVSTIPTTHQDNGIRTIELYYAPTASEKSTGLDIRITGSVVITYTAGTASGTLQNVQTMVYAN